MYSDNFRNGDQTGTIHITTPTQTWFGHSATSSSTLKTITGPNTVVVTASSTNSAAAESSSGGPASSGPNKGAIAGGVIVGVVGLGALIGAVFYALRLKKQRKLDDERRRHDSIMRIVNRGEKPGSFTGSDSRLEPNVIFQRRQSDGSIMDNQDYSRRILKVTNPDWRASRA
jgi:cell wall integrity and stress response component